MKKIKLVPRIGIILTVFIILLNQSCKEKSVQTDPDGQYKTGAALTPAAVLANVNEMPKLSLGTPLPSKVNLNMPPIGDQLNSNSCASWATAYAGMGYLMNKERGTGFGSNQYLFSPNYVYNQLPKTGSCGGTFYADNFDLLMKQGVCSLNDMPYTDKDCSTLPNTSQISAASKNKILKWETVLTRDIAGIKTLLANGKPVFITIDTYTGFNDPDFPAPYRHNPNAQNGKYHAVVVMGYDDSKYSFKVQNSWGKEWGDNGYFWIAYDDFERSALECYYIEPIIASNKDNITNELAIYLPFDGDIKDKSGNNVQGTIGGVTNGVKLTSDRFGKLNSAILFGGVDLPGWITYGSTSAINFTGSFSFSAWIKVADKKGKVVVNQQDGNSIQHCLFAKGNEFSQIASFLVFGVANNSNLLTANFGAFPSPNGIAGLAYQINSSKSDVGKWMHLVYTYSNGTFKIYKNGTFIYLYKVQLNMGAGNSKNLSFGSGFGVPDFAPYHFNGSMDEIRMYRKELTESEVQKLYLQ